MAEDIHLHDRLQAVRRLFPRVGLGAPATSIEAQQVNSIELELHHTREGPNRLQHLEVEVDVWHRDHSAWHCGTYRLRASVRLRLEAGSSRQDQFVSKPVHGGL